MLRMYIRQHDIFASVKEGYISECAIYMLRICKGYRTARERFISVLLMVFSDMRSPTKSQASECNGFLIKILMVWVFLVLW